jgi:phosphatidylglycerophosphatase A
MPVASGTFGSLVGAAIVWGYRDLPLVTQSAILVGLFAVGVWTSQKAGKLYREADSSRIVIDEIVGIMVTMLGIPVTAYWLVWGFVLFRFLDIAKFPPAHYFDARMKNGWGVMLDDVFAGIYGNIWLHLMIRATV